MYRWLRRRLTWPYALMVWLAIVAVVLGLLLSAAQSVFAQESTPTAQADEETGVSGVSAEYSYARGDYLEAYTEHRSAQSAMAYAYMAEWESGMGKVERSSLQRIEDPERRGAAMAELERVMEHYPPQTETAIFAASEEREAERALDAAGQRLSAASERLCQDPPRGEEWRCTSG